MAALAAAWVLIGAYAPSTDPTARAAATVFQTGVAIGQSTPAYSHWLPLVILQKADLVSDLPDDDRFAAYGADGKLAPLDLGNGIHELRILWMPFFAWTDGGWVFFSRTGTGQYSLAPATEIEMVRIERLLGKDPRTGYAFNPLLHMWGWLSLIPVLLLWRWWRRRDDARRIAEGYI